ncbi:hypothetical protein TEA_019061 [Camellia sinensis var. sinensis]|uniref:Branched-chain-amino-acid aminotransferase n=1 Tax=Camellia sinensis var. sinensis TaxID=542762 RepID=A0A4S4ES25_CAMSN|nr:hypothetical protein TEA_019061 [Camellia sinensis var. sinensis]
MLLEKVVRLGNLIRSSSFASLSKIGAYYTSRAASPLQEACEPSSYSDDESTDIDWNNIGFGIRPTDYIYITKSSADGIFEQGQLNPYGNIELNPSAGVLNYGQFAHSITISLSGLQLREICDGLYPKQGLFEGTKACRREDGRICLFRPDQNAIRMQVGAERMCMPSPSIDQFIDAVKQTATANRRWIPPPGKGSLYIRPLLIGSGPILGLAPAPEYTFLVYSSPVGNYFKEGLSPLNFYVEDEFHRATRGGAGGVKSITNYAPVLKALTRAKSRGFSDVIYLDSVHKKYLEEATSCNIFVVKVEERTVPVEELLDGDEVFCTGTAVGIVPVGTITYQGKRVEYKSEGQLVSRELYSTLVGIQSGHIEDKKGWYLKIE